MNILNLKWSEMNSGPQKFQAIGSQICLNFHFAIFCYLRWQKGNAISMSCRFFHMILKKKPKLVTPVLGRFHLHIKELQRPAEGMPYSEISTFNW